MRIRRLPCFLLFALAALAATGAHAACESGLAERMHAKLHPKRKLDESLAACKPWPAYPGRSIVVLPLVNGVAKDARKTLDLEVLVIQRPDNGNTERDTVLARLYQPEAIEEDAIRIQDIRIDTARYVLSPEARAFGLRVRYNGSSRANPYASETLRLYVPQGARLRQVLDEVVIDRDSGEWDTQCNGRFEQLRTLLSVGHGRSEGFADLTLSRNLTQSRAQVHEDGHCNEKALPPQYSSVVLHYDGERYRVPKSLRAP
ncbi:hypothetical protein DBA29_09110 [Xenophilus aerolatus]|nr:hypothetical protein [Xenophilus aerolatus]